MFTILTLVLLIFIVITCIYKNYSNAIKFKKEYEILNGKKNNNGDIHRTISIRFDNPFIYQNANDIIKRIESKETFYVYFGSSYCPWCRSVIEKAIEIAKKNNINKIYYVDIWENDHKEILRDVYTLNDNNEIELSFKGTNEYQKLLKYFNNILGDYNLTDKNGNKISVGEKRIFAPNFIYVENGKAKKITSGNSEKQTNSRMKFNDEILKDEEKLFDEFFKNEKKTN